MTFFIGLYYAIKVIAFLAFIGIILFLGFLLGMLHLVDKFKAWRKSGYCRHEWQLYNTHSYGPKADYKCMHCGEKRTM